ncbi:MAG: PAS domain-containing protein [Chloroflexi bacterium]|nr:PAS domain-containing protein [Chloroflexota bacterium]
MAVESAAQPKNADAETSRSYGLVALAFFLLFLVGLVTATADVFQVRHVDPRPFFFSLAGESLSLLTGSAIIFLGVQRFFVTRRSRPLLLALAFTAPFTANLMLALILAWSVGHQSLSPASWKALSELSTMGYALVVLPLAITPAVSARPPMRGEALGWIGGLLLGVALLIGTTAALATVLIESTTLGSAFSWLPTAVVVTALLGSLTSYAFAAGRNDRWAGYAGFTLLFLAAGQLVASLGFQLDWSLSYLNPLLKMGGFSVALFTLLGERPVIEEPEDISIDYVESMLQAYRSFKELPDRAAIAESLLHRCFKLTTSDYGSISLVRASGNLGIVALLSASRPEIDVEKYKDFLQVHRRDLRNGVVDRKKTLSMEEIQSTLEGPDLKAGPPALSSFMAAPLVVQNDCIGFIGLAKEETTFTNDDRNSLELLCSMSGLIIENTEIPAEIQKVAEEMVEGPKKMESQLRGKIVELEVIVESVSDGLIVVGPVGTIVRHNAAAEKILGRQVDEGLLVPLATWQYWKPRDAFGRLVKIQDTCLGRALFEGEEGRAVYSMEIGKNETVAVEVAASPIRDQTGKRSGAVATFHRVERVEPPRLQALPLEKPTPVEPYVRPTTNLVDVVLKVVELWQSTTQDHRIKVRSQLPKPTGQWEPRDIERVVGDLIQRAIDRSPEGGDIDVTVRQKDGEAQVIVKDYGVGRFFLPQADSPKSLSPAGLPTPDDSLDPDLTGSRQIVINNGGRMWTEGSSDHGTTIVFTLPSGSASVH